MNQQKSATAIEPEILVLLSGGLDSCACIDFYKHMGRPIAAMFIDYGQRAAKREKLAARNITNYYDINLQEIRISKVNKKEIGEIKYLNLFLLSTALMESSNSIRAIVLGIHAGTTYWDCELKFIKSMQNMILNKHNNIKILTPFINWHKTEIMQYVLDNNVPFDMTYSCEDGRAGGCGKCLSCIDRMRLADVNS